MQPLAWRKSLLHSQVCLGPARLWPVQKLKGLTGSSSLDFRYLLPKYGAREVVKCQWKLSSARREIVSEGKCALAKHRLHQMIQNWQKHTPQCKSCHQMLHGALLHTRCAVEGHGCVCWRSVSAKSTVAHGLGTPTKALHGDW
jgi:hypothetical protein